MCEDEEYVAVIRGPARARRIVRRRPSDGEDACVREVFLGAIFSIFDSQRVFFGIKTLPFQQRGRRA